MATDSSVSQISHDGAELTSKINEEIRRRINKAKWKKIKDVYYILSEFGLPYGGAVRDHIRRTSAATAYYAYCKEQGGINADANYNKQEVHPESYHDRLLIPNDIDIFITETNFKKLKKQLSAFNFDLQKNPSVYSNYLFKSCELIKAALTHEKWVIKLFECGNSEIINILFDCSLLKSFFELSCDVIIIKDDYLQHEEYINYGILYPPFGNPDFDVNLLSFHIDRSDNYEMKHTPLPYLRKLHPGIVDEIITNSIITNIKSERAFPIFPIKELYTKVFGKEHPISIDKYRIDKMFNKRYTIMLYNTILPPGIIEFWPTDNFVKEEDSSCSFCKHPFTDKYRAFNTCQACPNKMHLQCFQNFLENSNAPDTQTELTSILCVECGYTSYPKMCPCELLHFLIKLKIIIYERLKCWCRDCSIKFWCKGCNVYYYKPSNHPPSTVLTTEQ